MQTKILAYIGLITVIACVCIITACIIQWVRHKIDVRRWKYRYKHRFDKPPTAQCYCRDCKHWQYDHSCDRLHGWHTADNWFCWNAEPMKRERKNDNE